jgi:hypothetical protein
MPGEEAEAEVVQFLLRGLGVIDAV